MTDDTDTTHEATDEATHGDDHEGGDQEGDASGSTGEALAEAFDATADEQEAGADGANDAVREYLLKGALVMLVVLGVVATLQFYLSAQTAIARLASDQYRPVFTAGFNLVVLLAVGVGIAQVVRRLG